MERRDLEWHKKPQNSLNVKLERYNKEQRPLPPCLAKRSVCALLLCRPLRDGKSFLIARARSSPPTQFPFLSTRHTCLLFLPSHWSAPSTLRPLACRHPVRTLHKPPPPSSYCRYSMRGRLRTVIDYVWVWTYQWCPPLSSDTHSYVVLNLAPLSRLVVAPGPRVIL